MARALSSTTSVLGSLFATERVQLDDSNRVVDIVSKSGNVELPAKLLDSSRGCSAVVKIAPSSATSSQAGKLLLGQLLRFRGRPGVRSGN